jgi:hypothetical protein
MTPANLGIMMYLAFAGVMAVWGIIMAVQWRWIKRKYWRT